MIRLLPVFALLAAVACASSKPRTNGPPSEREAAVTYYPLKVGHSWRYIETALGGQQRHWRTTVTQQPSPDKYVLQIQPEDEAGAAVGEPARQTLQVTPRGIFDGLRFVLEQPVRQGHKWMAVTDARTAEKFELASTGEPIRVPAGALTDCVRVQNTIREPGDVTQLTEAVFCANVGMARTTIRILKPGKPDIMVSQMELRAFSVDGKQVLPRRLGD